MKLKILREQKGISQQKMAQILNIKQTTYSNYENEKTQPTIELLIKIADFFDISLDNLCNRPRPYDLPSTATNNQKQAINIILQLNDVNSLRAISYCAGLLAGQN